MKTLLRQGVRHFADKYDETSMCYLRIYRDWNNEMLHTILFSETSHSGRDSLNGSGSVLGVIERLSTEIVRQYGLIPEMTTILIQNQLFDYPFERVRMQWDGLRGEYHNPGFETIHQPIELADFLPEEFWNGQVSA